MHRSIWCYSFTKQNLKPALSLSHPNCNLVGLPALRIKGNSDLSQNSVYLIILGYFGVLGLFVEVLLNSVMETATNQSNVSKESSVGSEHDNTECCTMGDVDTRGGEIDVLVEDSVERVLAEYQGPKNSEPYIGMEFESEEATKFFYNAYARRVGFSIRVSVNRRSKRDGTNIGRDFVCSKEGFRPKKYKSKRPHTREGCMAMIRVKKAESGKWVITRFVKDHNHALVTPKEVPLLRSHRHVSDTAESMVNNFDGVRVGPSPITYILSAQSGGSGNIDFTLRDCTDHVQTIRKRVLGRDAQPVLEYFKRMQAINPSFFYAIQVDEEYHLTNCFWADSRSRMAYTYFGDVVTLDMTCRTNRDGMTLASFMGVNHHKQSVLFGCALLLDESETSFVWLFNTWLEAMAGLHPNSLITDQDPVIGAAIARVFPRTRHHFGKGHILRKFAEKLGHVEHRNINVKGDFFKCINMTEINDEFESCWWSLIDTYELRENEWLQSLYRSREQWVQVFLHDTLFANVSTTQRSEILSSFFYGYTTSHTTLQVFINQCEKVIDTWYEKELEEDFKTGYMKPIMKTGLPMENHAAEIYTRTMFLEFQEQLFQSLRHIAEITKEDGPISTFRVVDFGEEQGAYTVTFNVSEVRASCSCQMFEYDGILCRHVLIVFRVKNVMLLPPHYILKRWTRNATCGVVFDEHNAKTQSGCQDSRTLRYSDLCHQAIKYAAEGATTVDIYNVALHALQKAFDEVIAAKKRIVARPTKMFKR